jgi:hypothetical protein
VEKGRKREEKRKGRMDANGAKRLKVKTQGEEIGLNRSDEGRMMGYRLGQMG